jgi:hypothetical protein
MHELREGEEQMSHGARRASENQNWLACKIILIPAGELLKQW